MEVLKIRVFIDGAHKFGQNKFVEGKILGYAEALCVSSDRRHFITPLGDGIGKIMKFEATADEYVKLRNIVEDNYPGLCRFCIMNLEKEDK